MKKLSQVGAYNLSIDEDLQVPSISKDLNVDKGIQNNDCGLKISGQSIADHSEISQISKQKPTYNFTGKTVLIVDDVSFNLTLLEIYFKNTGAQILFASNGREALDACISNPNIDIVLMDIQMPVMNGLEATCEILKLKPGMPVIAVTAFVHPDDKHRCFDAGCIDFLAKPCSRDNLLMTVNNSI